MQNYFFHTKEKKVKYRQLTGSINTLIELFEKSETSKIYQIISVHKKDKSTWSLNMKRNNSACLLEDSYEAMIVEDIKETGNQIIIHKTRHSAFMRTGLEMKLREHGINRIFLCGVYTHGCIALSAIDGWSLDFEVIIAEDCIFSHRNDLSEFITERLKNMFHIEFLSNRQILESGLVG
ncbi:MAG: cysteine hydrolase [Spirochaetales bacterium]|nr:cysteine hydrolase [Spirochaetales bacterium]